MLNIRVYPKIGETWYNLFDVGDTNDNVDWNKVSNKLPEGITLDDIRKDVFSIIDNEGSRL